MGKKNRLYAKKPPLSAVDKTIYTLIMVFSVPLILSIFFVEWFVRQKVCFSDPDVVAATSHVSIYLLPFTVVLSLSLGIACSVGLDKKQPIFGNKKFKAKGFEPTQKVYPLFSREFRESLTYKEKRKLKLTAAIVAALLIVSAIIAPLGLFKRTTLDVSNVVCTYDSFGRVVHSAHVETADNMVITVSKGRSLTDYSLNISFNFGKIRYVFGVDKFGDMELEEVLECMLELKGYFSEGEYKLNAVERLENLIDYNYYTDAEASLVYELFDVDKQP